MGENYNTVKKIKPCPSNFNFENINYPRKNKDYEIFENNNESIALNILKVGNKNQEISYLSRSKNTTRENKIYLLFLENKHYTYVTKPHILLKRLK